MAPEFKDPRFDSLHHVLSILGAVDLGGPLWMRVLTALCLII